MLHNRRYLVVLLLILTTWDSVSGGVLLDTINTSNDRLSHLNTKVASLITSEEYVKKALQVEPHKFVSHDLKLNVRTEPNPTIAITSNQIRFVSIVFASENVVFGIDVMYNVWVSRDAFMTFTHQNNIDYKDQPKAFYPTADKNTFVILCANSNITYVTTDLGNTFTRFASTLSMERVLFHPTQKDFALGVIGTHLYATRDMCKTWIDLRDRVESATWCHAGQDGIPADRFCMVTDVEPEELGLPPNDNGNGRAGPSRLVTATISTTSTALKLSLQTMLPYEVSDIVIHPIYIYAIAFDPVKGKDDLFVSKNHGSKFYQSLLPVEDNVPFLQPSQILSDSYGSIWLGVINTNVNSGKIQSGNVFSSDSDGHKFSLVRRDVISLSNWWDLDAVYSLEGTYLANILMNGWEYSDNVEPVIRSHITYDNGRTWQTITPPTIDSNGNEIPCDDACTLNLFGITTWLAIGNAGFYGNFYSSPDAVGLILATGNVGYNLMFEPEDVNTYMSRDGGQTWKEIMKGSSVYEYGDHGGILVVAPNGVYINSFYYSFDEGRTWHSKNFTAVPVVVINIFSTSTTGERFVIFGVSSSKPVYFGVDFSNIGLPTCDIQKDYEEWSQKDGDSNCVLGRTTTYRRRKVGFECNNPDHLNHIVQVTNCTCTELDYECDYGYEPTLLTEQCAKADTDTYAQEIFNMIESVCNNPSNPTPGFYYQSSGYRLLPGDSCKDPLKKYQPTLKSCPELPPVTTGNPSEKGQVVHVNGGTIAIVIVLLFIAVIVSTVLGIVIGSRSQFFQKQFGDNKRSSINYKPLSITEDDDEIISTNFSD